MSWEVHITVKGTPDAIGAACARTGARPLSLVDESDGIRQEMLTLRVPATMGAVAQLEAAVSADLTLLRTKVEASMDDDITALYLEHHVKVRIPTSRLATLHDIAEHHRAHLSRRARRSTTQVEERYLTVRFEARDADGEALELKALLHSLATEQIEVAKVERERIVLDRVSR
jgi:hypothetical protein